jgi:hypothetical protein
LEELQRHSDEWVLGCNVERTNQGKRCQGRTPMETFLEEKALTAEKTLT